MRTSKAPPKRQLVPPKRDTQPVFIPPCLATLAAQPPFGENWIYEIKYDGYRLQAHKRDTDVVLFTRSGLDWTGRFAPIASALKTLPISSAIFDGEAVVEDEKGVTNFARLVDAVKAGRSNAIVYTIFDLLELDGTNLTSHPLTHRQALLATALSSLAGNFHVRLGQHLQGDGGQIFATACEFGLEGVICKRTDKPYRSGRHGDWLKLKCIENDEFVVLGYLDSTAHRGIGALVIGYYEQDKLIYAGRVGTGFSVPVAHELWNGLQPLRRPSAPLPQRLTRVQTKGVVWVKPTLVAQVAYRGWSSDGVLRHASFKALRADKPANSVRKPDLRTSGAQDDGGDGSETQT